MKEKRNTTVDFLRGLAVLLMILIHITYYFRNIPIAQTLWNYSQVAVPIFVFCSAYVFFNKNKQLPISLSYFVKRIKRLLIPYYFFLIGLFVFTIFIQKETLSSDAILKKVFLIGNQELDWLIVLFLYFLILMPLISFFDKKPFLFWFFGLLSLASNIWLFFYQIPLHFRLIMWLPWSLILFTTALFTKTKNRIMFYVWMISFSGITFLLFRYLIDIQNRSFILRDHKYPPNIYYLSYGIALIYILFILHKILLIEKTPLQDLFDFFSRYSYSIFFIHFLYLFILLEFDYKKLQWWGAFLLLTVISASTQLLWNYFFSMLKKAN